MNEKNGAHQKVATKTVFALVLAAALFGVVPTLISGGIMTNQAGASAEAATRTESTPESAAQGASQTKNGATPEAAHSFIEAAETKLLDLWIKLSRAQWVQQTFITYDTEILSAQADQVVKATTAQLVAESNRYEHLKLPEDVARKIYLLKHSVDVPAPSDPTEQTELTKIIASLESDYGQGKWCPDGAQGKCLTLNDMENIMAASRDPEELKRVWVGWHSISPPMRQKYARMVVLANKGTRDLGFADVGAMWRSGYDMPGDAFGADLDRLWQQLRPLYLSLYTYVRTQLTKKYSSSVVSETAPIPAELLGNMWAQDWSNVYPLVAPPNADPGFDLTEILKTRNITPVDMVHYGERFFMSLGFPALPPTFWRRSLFTKPRDREVVCHASAWDIDYVDDLRIKMCIEQKAEDFSTIHHELGHSFYQRAYDQQPPLFRDSANDGFHEAIGDTIALSVTPQYLKQIGLLETVPPASADTGLLLRKALEKVAFLPFGLLIDKWRWGVFSGKIQPSDYNKAWWDLRLEYQGIVPPVARSESDFDAGAKYHIPSNTPYARYFMAAILQFQFHRALCKAAGYTGPLNRCSIYNNKEAGAELAKMLEMGKSRPWPDALEALTGQREMDASAMLEYFAPLKAWLDEQNKQSGSKVGW